MNSENSAAEPIIGERDVGLDLAEALTRPTGWAVSQDLVDYAAAVAAMEARAAGIAAGTAAELIWLLEHPPIYTAGTSARTEDLLEPARFPVYQTGRGGQFTYHGPGQRVVYVMLDLKRQGCDVRAFVVALENWIIASLSALGVEGVVRDARIGVWVPRPELADGREDKIAAIGIRVRKWVSYHGFSINVAPALDHFDGIVPCGIGGGVSGGGSEYGVTSLDDLGQPASIAAVDRQLLNAFGQLFPGRRIANEEPPI